ncbi:MAG: CmpX, partial [uncultured Nocardioidaceae bacterium]
AHRSNVEGRHRRDRRLPAQPHRVSPPAPHRLHRREGRLDHRDEAAGEDGRGPEDPGKQLQQVRPWRPGLPGCRQSGLLADLRLLPVRRRRRAEDRRADRLHEQRADLPPERACCGPHLHRCCPRRGRSGCCGHQAHGRHPDRQDRCHRRPGAGHGHRNVHDPGAAADRSRDRPDRLCRRDVRAGAGSCTRLRSRWPRRRRPPARGRLHQGSAAEGPGPCRHAAGPQPGSAGARPVPDQHHLRRAAAGLRRAAARVRPAAVDAAVPAAAAPPWDHGRFVDVL